MNKCTDCVYHHTNSSYDGDKNSHCYMFKSHSGDACGQFKAIKNPEFKFTNGISLGVPIGQMNVMMSGKGKSRL